MFYAWCSQQLFHLLFRAASELGIANSDEEIEAKGGEVEGMRGKTLKQKTIKHLSSTGTQMRMRHEFSKSTEISLSTPSYFFFFNVPESLGLGILLQFISPENFHSAASD